MPTVLHDKLLKWLYANYENRTFMRICSGIFYLHMRKSVNSTYKKFLLSLRN